VRKAVILIISVCALFGAGSFFSQPNEGCTKEGHVCAKNFPRTNPNAIPVQSKQYHNSPPQGKLPKQPGNTHILPESAYAQLFSANARYYGDGFDYPVGKPNAVNYYKAQNFGDNTHLGEDWNRNTGGNTDLGDPVYATANGLVTTAENICCGWGKTIRVIHYLPNHPDYQYVESIYSHLDRMDVKLGQLVERGQMIGTIGTGEGRYAAHLHFEIRDFINMSMGPGYSDDQWGYLNPTPFIDQNRPY